MREGTHVVLFVAMFPDIRVRKNDADNPLLLQSALRKRDFFHALFATGKLAGRIIRPRQNLATTRINIGRFMHSSS